MRVKCKCKYWKKNIEILDAPYSLQLSAVGEYRGKRFSFCPWCGRRLMRINERTPKHKYRADKPL